mgnify:CR=1 FL=1
MKWAISRYTGIRSLEPLVQRLWGFIDTEGSLQIARVGPWWIGRASSKPYYIGGILALSPSLLSIRTVMSCTGSSFTVIVSKSQSFYIWRPLNQIREMLPALITGLEAGGWAALANQYPGKTCYFWRT